MIGLALVTLNVTNGVPTIMTYITYLFKDIGSSLSANELGIAASTIQLIGVCVAAYFVDRLGRKLLIVVSGVGCILCLLVFGVSYMMLKSWSFEVEIVKWIPMISFSCLLFIVSLGIQSLTFTVIGEILPERIKDPSSFLCCMLMWGIVFVNIKFLPFLNELMGLHGVVFLYAGICLIAMTIVIVFLPETKGKNREEIQKILE